MGFLGHQIKHWEDVLIFWHLLGFFEIIDPWKHVGYYQNKKSVLKSLQQRFRQLFDSQLFYLFEFDRGSQKLPDNDLVLAVPFDQENSVVEIDGLQVNLAWGLWHKLDGFQNKLFLTVENQKNEFFGWLRFIKVNQDDIWPFTASLHFLFYFTVVDLYADEIHEPIGFII